jgi:hypothetical protein
MNTVQHIRETVTRHELRMQGPITARDIQDFIFQVDTIFTEVKGRKVEYDDDYYVTGDEEGIRAVFETKERS